MLIIIWPLVCAFLNRIRGGMFGDAIRKVIPIWSTTTNRLSSLLIILLPLLSKFSYLECFVAWLLLYVGFIFGWKAWQYMENLPKDIFSLSLRGAVLSLPIGIWLGSVPLMCVGLLMGPLYALGKVLPAWRELDGTEIMHNLNWGEYLFGAALGAAVILSI
jgi:hypothetical protein